MRVIPGSHMQGLAEHSKSETEGNLLSINQEIPEEEIGDDEAFDLSLKAGKSPSMMDTWSTPAFKIIHNVNDAD